VTNGDDFNRAAESAKLLTKLSVFAGIGALILLITTVAVSGSRGSLTLQIAAIPYVFALIFAAAALVYGILRTSVAHEDEEKKLLEKRMESRALNVEEDVRFTAGRTFGNYRKYAPAVFAVLGVLITGGLLDEDVEVEDWNGIADVCVNDRYAMIQVANTAEGKYEFYFLMLEPVAVGESIMLFDHLVFDQVWNNAQMQEFAELTIDVQAYGVQLHQLADCFTAMTSAFPEHFPFNSDIK
jgi:hypothetical protein